MSTDREPQGSIDDTELTYWRKLWSLVEKHPDLSGAQWSALLEQAADRIDERNAAVVAEAERILAERPDGF